MKIIRQTLSIFLLSALFGSFCACSNSEGEKDLGISQPSATETVTAEQSTEEETTVPVKDELDEMLESMTLEEKVGQMFYVRCPDVGAIEYVEKYHLGGFILFGRDFEGKTVDEITADIAGYQSQAKIPLLIGVDEEGGTVVRVSDNPNLRESAFPSPKTVYQDGGWEAIEATETEKADLLLSLGINVNMAPVCDITSNGDSFMYDRSFSGDVEEVCTFVTKVVGIYNQKRLGSVLKHFPGYGDNTDTHQDMSYDAKPYEDFESTDFLPFEAGIAANADAILVEHNIVASMDEDYPASLSEKVHGILRNELNFDGVIMTDDLVMEAIKKYTGTDMAAVFAAKCGNDILCCTDVEVQYPAVLEAAQSGEIPEEQINASVKRILIWKQHLGLL